MKRLLTLLALFTVVLCSRAMPVERVCVVTDRADYVAGDTIRFRAFLLDAATDTKLTDFSQYIYVELLDPFGSVTERVKVKAADGDFIGVLPLDRELPGGTFTLAAYTWYMQNQGVDSFCRIPVQVRSLYSLKYKLDHSLADGRLTVSLADRATKRPVQTESLKLIGPKGILADAGRKKSSHTFRIPAGESVVKVVFDNFEQFIALPADSATYILEFFPEGGHLIAGQMNNVAIRATDPAGRPVPFSGKVADADGHEVAAITSRHEGLELLHIVPQPGVAYRAEVWGRTFPLPSSTSEATSLQIVGGKGSHFIVNAIGRTPAGLSLTVSKGGRPVLIDTIAAFPLRVARATLPAGQLLFTLRHGAEELSRRVVHNRLEPQAADMAEGDYAVTTAPVAPELTLMQEDMLALTAMPESEPVTFDYPVEMGGEISGIIRSRWRGKPLKNARINIIAPELSLAEVAVTDAEGRFTVNGIDWPDGTTFACQAIGPNGKREHNFVIETDTFPVIPPLPMPVETPTTDDDEAFNPLMAHGILLKEIQVTAPMTVEEQQEMAFRAMGIRTYGEDYFAERGVTTYEEAIRAFPGLYVEGGTVYSRRGGASIMGGSNQVEIVVNDMSWTPSYIEQSGSGSSGTWSPGQGKPASGLAPAKAAAVHTLTGGLLPGDVAAKQFLMQQSALNDLQGAYPFNSVKSIAYVPSYAAIFVSNSAAHGGGALLITTKPGGAAALTRDLFIQIHRPLGHQATPDARRATDSWNPRATSVPPHSRATGFTTSGQFIIINQ